MTLETVRSTEDIRNLVLRQDHLRFTGGGTKPALSGAANVSLSELSGVLQYDPEEYTFTALAGTKVMEVAQMLAEKQQYLPFDPPLIAAGATLGGTVAAGLSGSGRFRYGGVRDFLLGIRLVTGSGEISALGGKVVKNAAGFDFPKLMVGSLGRFGVMTELTFKVFPAPRSSATVMLEADSAQESERLLIALATAALDLTCLDLDSSHRIWARVAGLEASVSQRANRVLKVAGGRGEILQEEPEQKLWDDVTEFCWVPENYCLVKGAITPNQIRPIAERFADMPYRICAGGHLLWLGWPKDSSPSELDSTICKIGFSAIPLTGKWPQPWIGKSTDNAFQQRLTTALDPEGKFSYCEATSV